MKYLIVVIYLFLISNAAAQEIELRGSYCASFIGGESIRFAGKDSFYFGGFYCTYGVYGKGTCEIRNNYLYLYFEDSNIKRKKDLLRLPVVTGILNVNSISEFHLTIVDSNDIPIPFASVETKTGKSAKFKTLADKWGRAIFTIKNNSPIIVTKIAGIEIEQDI